MSLVAINVGEQGPHIGEISDLSIADHLELVCQLTLSENEAIIARPFSRKLGCDLINNIRLLNYSIRSEAEPFQVGKSAYSLGNPDGSNLSGITLYIG